LRSRKLTFNALPASFSHLQSPLWIVQKPARFACQGHFVSGIDQETGLAVGDDLGKSRQSRSHDGSACCHGFQSYVDAAMSSARDPNHFAQSEESRGIRLITEKMHKIFGPDGAHKLFQPDPVRTFPDQDQVKIFEQVFKYIEAPDGILESFFRNERSGTEYQAGIWPDP
jgi:hypothetical protein